MKRSLSDRIKTAEKVNKILYILVTASFILPAIFILIMMFTGKIEPNEAGYHSKADYVLMIVECLLGVVAINAPAFISKKLKFEIPVILYSMFIIFLYCAVFLGEVRSFYYVIPFWDSILHCFSAIMLGAFGMMLVSILNKNDKIALQLSPSFVAFFAFCFAVSIGAIWEIYEFTIDEIMHLNMQKYMTAAGEMRIGHDALKDTMKDIIIDVIGALTASIVGYLSLRKGKYWLVVQLNNKEK